MHALHIALQEGFVHDELVVSVDGVPVYSEDDVSTRLQLGMAATFDVSVQPGAHAVEVRLPRLDVLRGVQSLLIKDDTWLGISLRPDGQFDWRISATPFGYL